MSDAKNKILVVDDERYNINVLVGILKADYRIIVAKSGEEALKRADSNIPPDLILLDVMMPDMDGYTVCRKLKEQENTKNIPVIFITALGDVEDETKGFETGGVDYITKPIKPATVRARVKTHIELRDARKQLENQNMILEEKVRERTKELSESRMEIIHRLVFASEYKDPDTGSHIQRMSQYSALLAKAYGVGKDLCEMIQLASPMHDIGKIGIPDSVLLKPGKLDEVEWIIMKNHSSIGAKILSDSSSPLLQAGQVIALSHHEKWNGSGYPLGVKGENIPLMGRITALADVFDALTTKRPYKDAWPIDKAVREIKKGKGVHFEPKLVELFEDILVLLLEVRRLFPELSNKDDLENKPSGYTNQEKKLHSTFS